MSQIYVEQLLDEGSSRIRMLRRGVVESPLGDIRPRPMRVVRGPDRDGHAIVPFGTECDGHAWLHPECWNLWNGKRRKKAHQALAAMRLYAPSNFANEANFPDDFENNRGA